MLDLFAALQLVLDFKRVHDSLLERGIRLELMDVIFHGHCVMGEVVSARNVDVLLGGGPFGRLGKRGLNTEAYPRSLGDQAGVNPASLVVGGDARRVGCHDFLLSFIPRSKFDTVQREIRDDLSEGILRAPFGRVEPRANEGFLKLQM